MARLGRAIHVLAAAKDVDARDKPAHDGGQLRFNVIEKCTSAAAAICADDTGQSNRPAADNRNWPAQGV